MGRGWITTKPSICSFWHKTHRLVEFWRWHGHRTWLYLPWCSQNAAVVPTLGSRCNPCHHPEVLHCQWESHHHQPAYVIEQYPYWRDGNIETYRESVHRERETSSVALDSLSSRQVMRKREVHQQKVHCSWLYFLLEKIILWLHLKILSNEGSKVSWAWPLYCQFEYNLLTLN